jgi:hypothetical protein
VDWQADDDEELNQVIIDLKHSLSECSHNLIEIEKQIIDYHTSKCNNSHFSESLFYKFKVAVFFIFIILIEIVIYIFINRIKLQKQTSEIKKP